MSTPLNRFTSVPDHLDRLSGAIMHYFGHFVPANLAELSGEPD